ALRPPRGSRGHAARGDDLPRRGRAVTVVLLHDLGDPAGGAGWRAAAPTDWIVPDLPGHGATPATRTGHYDPMSAVAIGRWTMAHAADERGATLVGVGQHAHGALVDAA